MRRTVFLEKTLMLEKIEGVRKRGWQTMRWLHHWLNGHEFEQAPGIGDEQGGLACCNPWGRKESNTTEQLNWTEEVSLFLFENQQDKYPNKAKEDGLNKDECNLDVELFIVF